MTDDALVGADIQSTSVETQEAEAGSWRDGTPNVRAALAGSGSDGPSGFVREMWNWILEGNSAVVTALAVFLAIVVGGLLIAFTDPTVLHAWGNFFSAPGAAIAATWDSVSAAYSSMFEGAIFSPGSISTAVNGGSIANVFYPISETLVNATPLILTGLSVAVAFRAGLFNIGATGQYIGGAMIAGYIGFAISLPPFIHLIVCLLGGILGGAIVGFIVGFLKARTGAHEVIVTIMLNYVMGFLILYLLGLTPFRVPGPGANPLSPNIHGSATLPHLLGSSLRVNAGLLVALAAAAGIWWLLSRSTPGFELKTVGANPSAARSAGMSVERTWVWVMILAGGLAGLAGATVVQGTQFNLNPQIAGTYGIDAITVALLGRASPGGVVLASLLYGALFAGGVNMQAVTQTPEDIVTVIQALIVLFVAAPMFVRTVFHLRAAKAGGVGQMASKGWSG
jgi:simple sugar transport system permease protein